MYICEDCGTVLAEEDLHTERSYVSDYMGGCYENVTGCPCGGSVEEAEMSICAVSISSTKICTTVFASTVCGKR